jgi:hypothetical protein
VDKVLAAFTFVLTSDLMPKELAAFRKQETRIENRVDGSETAEGRIRLIQIEAMAFINTAMTLIKLPDHVVSVSCTALPEA